MNLYKAILGISVFVLSSACTNDSSDNRKRMRSIDKITIVDTLYEIQVDANEVVLDTLSMSKVRKNKNDVKVYNELTSMSGENIVIKKYNRDNGELFYQISETKSLNDTLVSIHENWEVNGKIQKAISIFKEPNHADTIHMVYKYVNGKDGKNKKMIIYERNSSPIVEVHYNEMEKPILEWYFYQGDTTEQVIYQYKEGRIISEKKLNKSNGDETLFTYGAGEYITSKKQYIKDSLVHESTHRKDKRGNILTTIIK